MSLQEQFKKWQGAILSASVILNVFLIGFMAARISSPPQPSPEDVNFQLRSLPNGISMQAREEIEHEVRLHKNELEKNYKLLKEAQEKVNKLVLENDFDNDELEALFKEIRTLEEEIQDPMQRAFISAMRKIDAESRRAIVRERRDQQNFRIRRPDQVDGERWRLSLKDGNLKLDLDAMKELKGMKGTKSLEKLKNIQIFVPKDAEEVTVPSIELYIVDEDDLEEAPSPDQPVKKEKEK